jgi:ABC-type nickel/cobalt efflux system permease component RcnA
LGFNSFIQSITCGSVNIKQIALGSLSVPVAILLGLILSLSSFIRSPVESAFGSKERGAYGLIFAIAFWMFWAGMFGESFSAGFAQSCGIQSSGKPLPK